MQRGVQTTDHGLWEPRPNFDSTRKFFTLRKGFSLWLVLDLRQDQWQCVLCFLPCKTRWWVNEDTQHLVFNFLWSHGLEYSFTAAAFTWPLRTQEKIVCLGIDLAKYLKKFSLKLWQIHCRIVIFSPFNYNQDTMLTVVIDSMSQRSLWF